MSAPRPIPGRDQQQQQQQPLQALAVWQPSVPNMSPPKSANIISGPLELKTRDPPPLLPPVPTASYPSLSRNSSGRRAPTPTLRHQGSNPALRHKNSQPSLRGGSNNEGSEAVSRPKTPNQSLATPDQSPLITSASSLRSHSPGPTSPVSTRSGTGASGYYSHSPSPSTSIDASGPANLLSPPSPGNNSNNNNSSSGSNSPLQRSNSRVQYTSPLFRSANNNSQHPSSSRSATSSPALSPSSSPGLRRQGSILKNAPKDAPYLNSNRTAAQLENLTRSWEPSPLQQQHHHQQFLQQQQNQQNQQNQTHVTPKSPVSGPATASAVVDAAAAAGPDSCLPTSSSLAAPHDASEPHPQQQPATTSPPPSSSTSATAAAATLPTAASQDAELTADHEAHSSSKARDEQTLQGSSNNSNSAPGENAASAPLSVSTDGAKSVGAEGLDEKKEDDQPRYAARDSTNYKVPVPPSPVTSPHVGPVNRPPNPFGFLSSDPSANNSHRQKPPPPPPMQTGAYDATTGGTVPGMNSAPLPHPSYSHSRQGSLSATSPITSPTGRRHPYHPWESIMPPMGHGQDLQDDGDHEDEGNITDGDVLSGGEDQRHRNPGQRRGPRPDAGGFAQGYAPMQQQQQQNFHSYSTDPRAPPPPPHEFTPTRSAPQPPNLQGSAVVPNSRQAEIQHIMYIQQQQALFLQEKAMNPPLNKKSSNGNLSGGGGDSKSKRNSRHRKKISVISDPKLLSSTNQVRTVPIVRPADDSDGDDAGTKSEYTSGGEGIKRTVRKMKKVVRHVLPQQHQSGDESDGGPGSKSDYEHRKGGLKQLKALKSKLAKKLHRPSQQNLSESVRDSATEHHQHHLQQHYHNHDQNQQNAADGSQHRPVQFFSEENLRSRYLAQAEGGGSQSFAEAAASLRRSNTTREGSVRRYGGSGDKEEYYSGDDDDGANTRKEGDTSKDQQVSGDGNDAAAKARKFASRTFDKDEMIEFRDASGDTFFVPKWDQDPRADEVRSVVSVVTSSSRKLERSTSNATVASTSSTNKSITSRPLGSIAERLQAQTTIEEDGEEGERDPVKSTSDATNPTSPTAAKLGSNLSATMPKLTTSATFGPLFTENGEDSDAERHRMAKQLEREILGEETESRRSKEQDGQEMQPSSTQEGHDMKPVSEQQQYVPPPPPSTSTAAAGTPVPGQFAESEDTKDVTLATTTATTVSSISTTTTTTVSAQAASMSSASNTTSPRTSVGGATSDPRASVVSDGSSSNVSSIGGVVNAQVLTRQPSMKRSIKRQGDDGRMQLHDSEEPQVQSAPVGLGISMTPASPTHDGPNKVLTRELDVHGRLDAVLAQMSLNEKSLPSLPAEAEESNPEVESSEITPSPTSSLHPPLKVAMPIRPLSPIKRANSASPKSPIEFFRNASIGGLASMLTGAAAAAAAAASSKDKVNAPLPQPPTEISSSPSMSSGANSARSSSQSITVMSLHGTQIDLPSAPTAPLPTPAGATSTAIQPPASPLPAVIARQNSSLAERQSVKSMYADSIYDYYTYDSASEHESIAGDAAHRLSVISISQQHPPLSSSYDENGKRTIPSPAPVALVDNKVDLTPAANNRVSVLSTRSIKTPPPPSPSASVTVPSPSPGTPTEKGEEQHVHFEELPKAVPFRMSMMTTVAVDESDPLIQQQHPLRPPRHPMRQSRLSLSSSISSSSFSTVTTTTTNTNTHHPNTAGSHVGDLESNPRASMLSMMSSVASGASDFTATDSWISKRQTRDLENWDEEELAHGQAQNHEGQDGDQPLLEHEVQHEAGEQEHQYQLLMNVQDQEQAREILAEEPSSLFYPEDPSQSLEGAVAAHHVLEADIKPRHPLSVSGSSSESESISECDLEDHQATVTPNPTTAIAEHMDVLVHSNEDHHDRRSSESDNQKDEEDDDQDILTVPVQAREPRVRQRQWKRKTWDPNHRPNSGSGSYDDSDDSSSSDSATSSSDSEHPSSSSIADRRSRRLSRRRSSQRSLTSSAPSHSSASTMMRGRRRTQRSLSPSSSFVSSRSRSHSRSRSRSRSRSLSQSRSRSHSRSRSRSTSSRHGDNGVRQSVISSSRRSSRSSHFYFDGHSTSDEEEQGQGQHANQQQTMYHQQHDQQYYQHQEKH
ncbi:hypothetical protein BGZ73_007533 [Actinomortierella ambigua]|nr:hypothetical protein BGZ73_007533 [Actinomortierella ambigua]